jgi:type I restriction enzyme S subunit
MVSEWTDITLGGVTDFLSGGTPSKDRPDYWAGSIPWVSAKDMKRFRLDDTEDHVTEDGVANGTKLVPAGTVLLLARGMTLLNDVPICIANRPMTFNQDVKALRPKPHVRDDFLPYLLLGNKERLLSLVDLAGHGTGRLNSDELKALDVVLPPEGEQRTIAHILGTLDDKIELNRRMSETLEAMARALFKSWFVDFDPVRAKAEARDPGLPKPLADLFPARLVDSEVGEIPEGWDVGTFGDVVELLRDQENPLDSPDASFRHFSIPAFDEGQWPKEELGETIKSLKSRVMPGVVLLSKLNPEIERVWLVDVQANDRAVCSTEFLVLRPRPPAGRAIAYCLARSPLFRQELEGLATGTSKSHQRAQAASILALSAVRPSTRSVQAFERQAGPLLARALEGLRESRTIAALRDSLLPKLISGELRVEDLRTTGSSARRVGESTAIRIGR